MVHQQDEVSPGDALPDAELERLQETLLDVLRAMRAAERTFAQHAAPVDPEHAAGALNLVHYLALRAREMRPVQARLARFGLSSLGRCEGHARASVEAVLAVLARLGSRSDARALPSSAAFGLGAERLGAHTRALLGDARSTRSVRILVTLAPEAAEDVSVLRSWIEQGMDCVRVNCAHDDPDAWSRMIAQVRRASRECGTAVRVLMDLAGPKLRTGPVAPGPQVLKLQPKRDAFGRVSEPARIHLRARRDAAEASETAPSALVPGEALARLSLGDELDLVDARGASRALRVSEILRDGVAAESERTCYLVPGTLLHRRGELLASLDGIPPQEGVVHLVRGERLVLTRALEPGCSATRDERGSVLTPATIGCTLDEVFAQVRVGEHVWFDDGRVGGVLRSVSPDRLEVEITEARAGGGRLRADKGINLPESRLDLPALTAKDLQDLRFVVEHADAVALSFVHRVEDVAEIGRRLRELGRPELGVVLKIETKRGFEQLPALLLAAMRFPSVGVMIARGDLAVECGWERLAELQEEILWLCEAAHVPVIWATQVLESLSKHGRPSRAEITDAAMSERAECVMLNKGPRVGEAITALDGILRRMQDHQHKKSSMLRPLHLAAGY